MFKEDTKQRFKLSKRLEKLNMENAELKNRLNQAEQDLAAKQEILDNISANMKPLQSK